MYQYRTPVQVASRNNGRALPLRPQGLGQIDPTSPVGRDNLMKITSAVALGGGAAWALMSVPGASKKNKLAFGLLGGGLAATALLSFIDGIS